jgi:hypothetical protein
MPNEIPKGYIHQQDGSWSHPSRVRLGFIPCPVPEPVATPSPNAGSQGRKGNRGRVDEKHGARPAVRVSLIIRSHRGRKAKHDDDNWKGGVMLSVKPLRDAIARSLGLDDHQSWIEWEYYDVESDGEEGVMVMIEAI